MKKNIVNVALTPRHNHLGMCIFSDAISNELLYNFKKLEKIINIFFLKHEIKRGDTIRLYVSKQKQLCYAVLNVCKKQNISVIIMVYDSDNNFYYPYKMI